MTLPAPTPEPPTSRFTLPRLKLPPITWPWTWSGLRRLGAVLATIALVAAFAGVFQLVRGNRGGHSTGSGQTVQIASGPAPTATATALPGATSAKTPPSTKTPPSASAPIVTVTPIPQHPNVVVTQNQDMRPACIDPNNSYTVVLANHGNVAANWHVDIPVVAALPPPSGPAGQPLFSPRSSYPFWVIAQPADGSVAPGQTASFDMVVEWPVPCGGKTYHASIKLTFPSGATQPDIPLTYAGTGPAPYSQIQMLTPVPPTTSIMLICPTTSVRPTFVVAFKNTGNATAYPSVVMPEHIGVQYGWADFQWVEDPPNEPVQSWLYAGETWTYTFKPYVDVVCDGTTVYHLNLNFNLAQSTSQTITINVTFHP